MAELPVHHGEGFNRVDIDAAITVGGKLQVCLVQLAPGIEAIAADAGRPIAVAAITHLLVGGGGHAAPALSELNTGLDPLLIVLPEYAFGSSDWSEVDEAIRSSNRTLVVVAGFGATEGKKVLDWAAVEAGAGDTVRQLTWDQASNGIGNARPVNGGWCWIHRPGVSTHCLVHLKGSAEQNHEAVEIADLQFGPDVTHVQFTDLDLFPMICADMLTQAAGNPHSKQAGIARALDGVATNRPAIIVGSLLQEKFNIAWQRAIDSMLNQVLVGRPGVVSLCNHVFDKPVKAEDDDRWRTLTGVFGQLARLHKGQVHLPCCRSVTVAASGTVGAVARHTEPIVVCGYIDFEPQEPLRKFVFHADMQCPLGAQGLVAPVTRPPCHHQYELVRFVRRHPAQDDWSPRVREGADNLIAHFKSEAKPRARRVLSELLHGVSASAVDPDVLHEGPVEAAVEEGLNGLSTLTTLAGISWQPSERQDGQLLQDAKGRHMMVWRDPVRNGYQMRSELGSWRDEIGDHPDLVVFGAPQIGELAEGAITSTRRDDLTALSSTAAGVELGGALAPEPKEISSPRVKRNVAVIPLSAVAALYTNYQEGTDDQPAIDAFLTRIDNVMPGA
jgi:hypothetical protein